MNADEREKLRETYEPIMDRAKANGYTVEERACMAWVLSQPEVRLVLLEAEEESGAELTWRPIATAPKDGSMFFAILNPTFRAAGPYATEDVVLCAWDEDQWYDPGTGEYGDWFRPTHWMPIPPSPDNAPQPEPEEGEPEFQGNHGDTFAIPEGHEGSASFAYAASLEERIEALEEQARKKKWHPDKEWANRVLKRLAALETWSEDIAFRVAHHARLLGTPEPEPEEGEPEPPGFDAQAAVSLLHDADAVLLERIEALEREDEDFAGLLSRRSMLDHQRALVDDAIQEHLRTPEPNREPEPWPPINESAIRKWEEPERDEGGEPQTIRVCVHCHQIAESDAHPDDVPDVCPSCFDPWKVYVSRPTTPVGPEPCAGHHLFVSGKCYHCGTKATEVLDAEPGTPVEEQEP